MVLEKSIWTLPDALEVRAIFLTVREKQRLVTLSAPILRLLAWGVKVRVAVNVDLMSPRSHYHTITLSCEVLGNSFVVNIQSEGRNLTVEWTIPSQEHFSAVIGYRWCSISSVSKGKWLLFNLHLVFFFRVTCSSAEQELIKILNNETFMATFSNLRYYTQYNCCVEAMYRNSRRSAPICQVGSTEESGKGKLLETEPAAISIKFGVAYTIVRWPQVLYLQVKMKKRRNSNAFCSLLQFQVHPIIWIFCYWKQIVQLLGWVGNLLHMPSGMVWLMYFYVLYYSI